MSQNEFSLAHLTDFHLFQAQGASWQSFLNKRCLSYLSWRLHRARSSSSRVLSDLLAFLRTLAPDHVVVTGDLTHMGMPREIMQASHWLARIGPPDHVFVVPGNHDAMVSSTRGDLMRAWGDYMASDQEGRARQIDVGPATHPAVRIRNGVALIGLSSARPTRPFSAAGELGKTQQRRLAAILDRTGRERLFRVVLIHHPVVRGQVKPRKSLRDAAALGSILGRHGAELVLHGHIHRHSHKMLPGPVTAIPVIGLPASTADQADPQKRACLRVYVIRTLNDGWEVAGHDHRLVPRSGRVAAAQSLLWRSRPNVLA